jgi:predicted nucleic acid-binding protein
MADVLVDTDVFVDHFRGGPELTLPDAAMSYSIVTRIELLSGKRVDEEGVQSTLSELHQWMLTNDIADCAGTLRRETGLALAYAVIAATAIVHELPLMTRNRRHFDRVTGLQIHDPR